RAGPRPEGSRRSALPPPCSENILQLVGLRNFELVVAAILRRLLRSPAQEDRRMPEAIALQMIVFYFADALDAQRLPREILARAPPALRSGHASRHGCGAGPILPR